MCKVSVDLPSFPPVKGLLNVHGGGSEGLEGDDDVGDVVDDAHDVQRYCFI